MVQDWFAEWAAARPEMGGLIPKTFSQSWSQVLCGEVKFDYEERWGLGRGFMWKAMGFGGIQDFRFSLTRFGI